MATQIHFVRRDENLAVEEEPQAIADAASESGPIRLTSRHSGGVIFVNWANVLYIEEVPLGVPASAAVT
jgi:hypothetical protein